MFHLISYLDSENLVGEAASDAWPEVCEFVESFPRPGRDEGVWNCLSEGGGEFGVEVAGEIVAKHNNEGG